MQHTVSLHYLATAGVCVCVAMTAKLTSFLTVMMIQGPLSAAILAMNIAEQMKFKEALAF